MEASQLEKLLKDKNLDKKSKDKIKAIHEKISEKQFSDLLDEYQNQYVNFVQEGGGVWGVALVGYLYALETFGIRFLRIAGTSAGAINTMLIAALGDRSQNKSGKIKDILFDWKFEEFMDGKSIVKKMAYGLIKTKGYFSKIKWVALAFIACLLLFPFVSFFTHNLWWYVLPFVILLIFSYLIYYYYHLFKINNIGLNPGNAFEKKMEDALESFNVNNVKDLNNQYNKKENDLKLNYRFGNTTEYFEISVGNIKNIQNTEKVDPLKFKNFLENTISNEVYRDQPFYLLRADYTVITTDINTKIKVELPKMADLYWSKEELSVTSPAKFVRASMSVPYFFEPMIKKIDDSKSEIVQAWKFWLNADPKQVYKEAVFIDGGSISNFPIDIFHESDIFYPRLPVFGVRLVDQEELGDPRGSGSKKILNNPGSFLGNIFDTLKGYNDKTFLTKYTFYSNHSIQIVDCSPSNWLNFFMDDKEKNKLFNIGFQAGLNFLEKFDWEKYKYERMLVALKEKGILKQEGKATVG